MTDEIQAKENIWVHAVSVGEILAMQGLLNQLRQRYPRHQIVLSTVTATGYDLARSRFQHIKIIFAPLDFHSAVTQYIQRIKPKVYINAETEIWPNLFWALYKQGIPIVLINGRVSLKSFAGYKILKFFVKEILSYVNIFCMQSEEDAGRVIQLGARKERVRVSGNMKFDDVALPTILTRQDVGLLRNEWLWVAGSTHPGEEEIILEILQSLTEEFPQLRLVLAPRHPERTLEIVNVVRQKNLLPVKFSELAGMPWEPRQVVIMDTMGQLRSLYGLAEIVFVGKSLTGYGGQNIIEPASFAKPIIVGPNTQNFKDVVELFKKASALMQVNNTEEFKTELIQLLKNPHQREAMGAAAREVIQENQGATERTLKSIGEIFKSSAAK